jgi:hypothetical protein
MDPGSTTATMASRLVSMATLFDEQPPAIR